MPVFQLPGSNAIDTADAVYAKMEELKASPTARRASTTPSPTTRRSSCARACTTSSRRCSRRSLLVVLVVLVFLQNWRAAIIPLLAVPVSLIGTFAVMRALGFSLNNLSLFGLVLAIGIVVDDAIVVVENVERWIERGLSPARGDLQGDERGHARRHRDRARPVGGVRPDRVHQRHHRAVLPAVRPHDRDRRTLLSAFNSLTLSPALAALLLKPRTAKQDWLTRLINFVLGWFFRLFNRGLDGFDRAATPSLVRRVVRLAVVALVVYVGLLLADGYIGFKNGADRLHPAAGPGLSARQRCRCPTRRRSTAPTRRCDRLAEMARKTRGREGHVRHRRLLVPHRRHEPVERRHDVRVAQAVRRARRNTPSKSRHGIARLT